MSSSGVQKIGYSNIYKNYPKLPERSCTVDVLVALENVGAAKYQLAFSKGLRVDCRPKAGNILNRVLSKNNMPSILHYTGGQIIRKVVSEHPVVVSLIVAQWALEDLLSGDSELRTARGRDNFRDVVAQEQRLPRIGIDLLGVLARSGRVPERSDFVGATGTFLAAEVGVTVLLHKVDLQRPERFHVAVVECVGVPGARPAITVAVDENNRCWEIVVVVDDVLEVGESFATLVHGSVSRRVLIVDRVDEAPPPKFKQSSVRFGDEK